ncbi:DUF1003 domain-containing protein [Nakamurella lactea]|uniref:DUF1003 domain-containing protein n=1 Tax=Nakamurella lactea TaxID=459515 RepID=UPI0004003BAA|nr:DUF1003 domain-containing protein [Nakamurella lactea]
MTKPTSRNNLSDPYVKTSLVPHLSIDRETFGVVSERFARYMGTSTFIVQMTVVIALWLLWNTLAPPNIRFDPYTFTFLTLVLSLQASYAAPLILLAQNRQDDRDRVSMEEDRARAAQTKADTEYLARELASLRMNIGDVATRDYVRGELDRMRDDLHELTDALRALGLATPGDGEAGSGREKAAEKTKKAKRGKGSGGAGGVAVTERPTE